MTGSQWTAAEAPIKGVPGYLAVADHLKREVSLGRLLPGDRLPPERVLAKQFGVARETLRQAFRVLEGDGHITIARGSTGGAVIQDIRTGLEEFRRDVAGRIDTVLDLIDFRREVESSAVALAATRRSEEDLARMRAAQTSLSQSLDRDEFRRADTEFHLAIASASRNAYFLTAVEDVRAEMFAPFDHMPFEILLESSYEAHGRILSAVSRQLSDVASGEMRNHIDQTREELLHLLFN